MAGRPILRRTCAQPVSFRAMPENEIPRALHVDIYLSRFKSRVPRPAFTWNIMLEITILLIAFSVSGKAVICG